MAERKLPKKWERVKKRRSGCAREVLRCSGQWYKNCGKGVGTGTPGAFVIHRKGCEQPLPFPQGVVPYTASCVSAILSAKKIATTSSLDKERISLILCISDRVKSEIPVLFRYNVAAFIPNFHASSSIVKGDLDTFSSKRLRLNIVFTPFLAFPQYQYKTSLRFCQCVFANIFIAFLQPVLYTLCKR